MPPPPFSILSATRSAVSGASCGLELPGRGPVLVYAERAADGELLAGLCGGSRAASDAEAVALSHGRRLAATGTAGVVGAFGPDGRCIALLEDTADGARPTVVFAPSGS